MHEHRAGARGQPQADVLSVAPALAEAINRIHNGESVSALFDLAARHAVG